jgi:hypothetical protein
MKLERKYKESLMSYRLLKVKDLISGCDGWLGWCNNNHGIVE